MAIALDLNALSEDERITLIGASVMEPASSAELETDAKADRYIRKLQKQFPGIRVVDRGPGPAGTIMVKVAGPLR